MGQFKQGLDYFPFTIGLLKDRKLRKLKVKFGYMVTIIYISLLELIYSDKGYYINYGLDLKEDVICDILENLQGRYTPEAETVEQVIDGLVACGLFSDDQFKSEILTSKRIQQIYYSATVERKAVDVNFDIWLLDEKEMRKLSSKSVILANFLNRLNEEDNRSNEEQNQSNGTKSKKEESKKEESIYHLPQTPSNQDMEIEEDIQEEEDERLNYFYDLVIEAIKRCVRDEYQNVLEDIAKYCKSVEFININGSNVYSWEYLQELYYICGRASENNDTLAKIFDKVNSQPNIINQRKYLMTAIYNNSKLGYS